jgi:hypothetical protein
MRQLKKVFTILKKMPETMLPSGSFFDADLGSKF